MPTDAKEVKKKIIEIIKAKGPSLPIQIAKETGIGSLFAGAFLSELAEEKEIKISHLKVGGSPLYFLQGQEAMLDNFFKYLPGKEKEAFSLLKEKKILKDKSQEPAIRVALRSIKDFSLPFQDNGELFWRFHSASEQEILELIEKIPKPPAQEQKIVQEQKEEEIKPGEKIVEEKEVEKPVEAKPQAEKLIEKQEEKKRELDIFGEEKPIIKKVKEKQKPEKFLEEVKAFLTKSNMELVGLEFYDKKEIIAKVRFNLAPEKIHLLVAYDKKRIDDSDVLKAYKHALKNKLDYMIFFKGELPKKMSESIAAHKSLLSTEKIEV